MLGGDSKTRGESTGGMALGPAALNRLMPMHLVIDAEGIVRTAGPTLCKVFSDRPLEGQAFFSLFEVRRPVGVRTLADLRRRAGDRMVLVQTGGVARGFRGIALPLAHGEGMVLNLSFGIGVIEAVRDHALTDADFAATDLAIELLYLMEAKSAVTDELRELNLRLEAARQTAEAQALTDTLTGLRNRRALDASMGEVLATGTAFGLMHIDLDFFKAVNDTLGHAAGDHVLREVARMLCEETRKGDTVARLGGDEFVILFPGLVERQTLATIAGRIVARLSEPIPFQDKNCRISASIGIAVSSVYERPTPGQVLNDADEALYASKHAGRGMALFHGAKAPAARLDG